MWQSVTTFVRKHAIWVILLIGVLPFFSTLSVNFLSDDWEFLYHAADPVLQLQEVFFTNTNGHTNGGSYRPMVNMFWAVMYQISGLNAWGYHAVILCFYGVSIWLLYQTIRRLQIFDPYKEQVALFASMLFVLFPNKVEAISWIAVINDTMLVTCLMGAWFLFVQYLQQSQKWYLFASFMLYFLALGTKEVAITFPVVIFGTVLLEQYKSFDSIKEMFAVMRRAILLALPYALLVGVFFLLRYYVIGLISEDYTGADFSFWNLHTLRAYVSITISHLLVDPLRSTLTQFAFSHAAWVAVIALYLTGYVALFSKRKVQIVGTVLCVWFLLSIFPASRFGINFLTVYASAEGERYAYYPSIFFALLLASVLVPLYFRIPKGWGRGALALFGILVSVYWFSGTIAKVTYWNTASDRSEAIAVHTKEKIVEGNFDGVVLMGLPDNLHGAFMWRNALVLRLHHFDVIPLEPNDILVTSIRSVVDPDSAFHVSLEENNVFVYRTTGPYRLVSQPVISVHDYTAVHKTSQYERMSISYDYYSNEIHFEPSDDFIQDNSEKNIGLFFFDGKDNWHVYSLSDLK